MSEDGGFGDKLQELAYLPEAELANADRTRKALVQVQLELRTLAHAVLAEGWLAWL